MAKWERARHFLRRGMSGAGAAEGMALFPALTLGAYWLGGETALLALAVTAPLVLALLSSALRGGETPADPPDWAARSGLGLRQEVVEALDRALASAPLTGRSTACLVLRVDDAAMIAPRHGRAAESEVLLRLAERICAATRPGDIVARLPEAGFAVALAPVRRIDLESVVQIAARLQAAVAPPVAIHAGQIHLTVSVGFCLGALAPRPEGAAMLEAAGIAAEEAMLNGPSAIRCHEADMARRREDRLLLRDEIALALEEGQVRAHFQPQISTETGLVSGVEALARWHHPDRGILPPKAFLPLIEEAGLSDRLGEVVLFGALSALTRWDRAGLNVPGVSINFSVSELRNPRLADRVKWELDRFDIAPGRLTVEVLENVVADTGNDVILGNIAALSALGCGIDLDDFGTGRASLTNLRRFRVRCLKIDRSFVTKVDEDPEQQRMVAAILSLAERLGVGTVAEGVETPGEHAVLAQLGCGHIQGFGVARPMPVDEAGDWIARHREELAQWKVGPRRKRAGA